MINCLSCRYKKVASLALFYELVKHSYGYNIIKTVFKKILNNCTIHFKIAWILTGLNYIRRCKLYACQTRHGRVDDWKAPSALLIPCYSQNKGE